MPKEKFIVTQRKNDNTDRSEGKFQGKHHHLGFAGKTDEGIEVKLSIVGPKEIMDQKFTLWPLAPKAGFEIILQTSQLTLTGSLNQAASEGETDETDDLEDDEKQTSLEDFKEDLESIIE